MTMIRPILLAVLMLGCATHANAQSGAHPVLDPWYAALFSADSAKLDALLTPDASIVLEDIGITQTKAEFLDSMSEWSDAVDGATIAYRLDPSEPADAAGAVTFVCYRFPGNSVMMRERFTFAAGKVSGNVQTPAGKACEGF